MTTQQSNITPPVTPVTPSEAEGLNATNPEALTYRHGELLFTVLGGVRPDGLDRMRVTLKTEITGRRDTRYLNNPELAGLALRHNLDLYNDIQCEKFIRKCAERLETGSIGLTKALAGLTAQLEEYRLSLIAERDKTADTVKPLTAAERAEALDFLTSPNLLTRTGEAIGRGGVIGEETNRLLMYLIFTSRKCPHPLHCISLGASGTGKTHLQESVGALIPEEDKTEITTLSENAFYYFGRQELRHKLLLIEDLDGAENALYPLRELQSKKKISKTVAHKDSRGNTKTVHLTVEGPVSVAGCTTRESIYEDNANRSFLLYLDESPEQDERIMEHQRKRSAGTVNAEEENRVRRLLQNTQRMLQPVAVRNPYAESLKIPAEVFKPRRTNAHYLQFIEAVTFYHQYQREIKTTDRHGEPVEPYIETVPEDIEAANLLLRETLLRKSDELNTACRRYFEHLKAYLRIENKSSFTAKEVRQALRINHGNQKRYMLHLLQGGHIRKGRNKGKIPHYEITDPQEYERLKAGVYTVLDTILKTIKQTAPVTTSQAEAPVTPSGVEGPVTLSEVEGQVQSSSTVHPQNEPHKEEKNNNITQSVQKTTEEREQNKKRIRRTPEESLETTYEILCRLYGADNTEGVAGNAIAKATGFNTITENRNLRQLTESGRIIRIWKDRKYLYKPNN